VLPCWVQWCSGPVGCSGVQWGAVGWRHTHRFGRVHAHVQAGRRHGALQALGPLHQRHGGGEGLLQRELLEVRGPAQPVEVEVVHRPATGVQRCEKSRIVTVGVSGGGSLTRVRYAKPASAEGRVCVELPQGSWGCSPKHGRAVPQSTQQDRLARPLCSKRPSGPPAAPRVPTPYVFKLGTHYEGSPATAEPNSQAKASRPKQNAVRGDKSPHTAKPTHTPTHMHAR
jgi:hypothetical protein